MLAALRKPELVTHLVLTVTSGGMDLSALDSKDWRPSIRAAHPGSPDWFSGYREDLTPRLAGLSIQAPLKKHRNLAQGVVAHPDGSIKMRAALDSFEECARKGVETVEPDMQLHLLEGVAG